MLTLKDKAAILLCRLYQMRKVDFNLLTVEDILKRATTEQIEFYYYWICEV